MLKIMANLIRPATERRTTRHTKSRSPPPPAGTDELEKAGQQQRQQHTIAVAPRRTAKSTPLLSLDEDKHNAKIVQHTPEKPARASARKRSASAIADATPDTRPPTKVTVTQPHGELLRITNGVPKALGIGVDDLPSGASTPGANGAGQLSVPTQTHARASRSSGDKRSLRSQDGGSRLKSDLAIYFSSYDDVIAGVEKTPEFLDIDAPIYVVDEPLKTPSKPQDAPLQESSRSSASPSRSRKARGSTPARKLSNPSIPPSQSSTAFQVVNYSTISKHLPASDSSDPLSDLVYFAQHRRLERKEKQLRNIEKERAMHEKQQLERLLDGLLGPDWLKVMGVTGVTDGEKKEWEPKRDFFVREVEALVDKFRLWKQQEKKARAEKEAVVTARDDEDEEEESESEREPRRPNGKLRAVSSPHPNQPTPPKPRRPPQPHGFLLPYIPPEPTTPFTSFYSKPHLRTAALGKHRHGRNITAFGEQLPDWHERDFELPDDFVSKTVLTDNARKRRRTKRESAAGS